MICNNKYCWRCQRVHKKDREMAEKGFYPYDMGEMGRGYIKWGDLSKIEVSGNDGGSIGITNLSGLQK